jgi:hypothetical protein
LSNEEKTNDYENFEKGKIYMKILKKGGGSREKGGGGNEIHAPCACGNSIKTFDVSTLYTTITHAKLKNRVREAGPTVLHKKECPT